MKLKSSVREWNRVLTKDFTHYEGICTLGINTDSYSVVVFVQTPMDTFHPLNLYWVIYGEL